MSQVIRDLVNLVKGRKKIVDEPVTFSQAIEILEKAKPYDGIYTSIKGRGGAHSTQHNQSTKRAYEALCTFFCEVEKPDFYTKFEGKHVVYAGKGEQLHYLDLKNKRGLPGGIATDDQKGVFSFRTHLKKGTNREKEDEGLTNRLSVIIGTAGTLLGIFFLSSNLTGNVIGGLNQTSSNIIGGVLFLTGLTGAFFYLRRR